MKVDWNPDREDRALDYRADRLVRKLITPPGEEIVAYISPMPCACGYERAAHVRGRCPDENEARAAWGDR